MASRVRRCQTFNQVHSVAVAALDNRLNSDDPSDKTDVYSKLQVQEQNQFFTKMQKPPTLRTETGISHHSCNTLTITASLGAETIQRARIDKAGTLGQCSYFNCPASSYKRKGVIRSETDPHNSKESSMNVNCHYKCSMRTVGSDDISVSSSTQRHETLQVGDLDIQHRPISDSCLSQPSPHLTKHSRCIPQLSVHYCNKMECITVNQQNQGNASKLVIHSQDMCVDDQNERAYDSGDAIGRWSPQIAVGSHNLFMPPSRVRELQGLPPAPLFEHHHASLTLPSVFIENSSDEDTTLYTAVPGRCYPSSIELSIADDHSTVKRPGATDTNCTGAITQNGILDHGESWEAYHFSASHHELRIEDRNSDGRQLNSMTLDCNLSLGDDDSSGTTSHGEPCGDLIRGLLSRSSTPTGIVIPLHDSPDNILNIGKVLSRVSFPRKQTSRDIPAPFLPNKNIMLDLKRKRSHRTSRRQREVRGQNKRFLSVLSATESRQTFSRTTQAKSPSNYTVCSKMQLVQPLRCQSVPPCSLTKPVRTARLQTNGGGTGSGMVGPKCKDAVKSKEQSSTAANPLWKPRAHSTKQTQSWSVGAAGQAKQVGVLHPRVTGRRKSKVHKKYSRHTFSPREHWKNESTSENFESHCQPRQYNGQVDQRCVSTKFLNTALTRSSSDILAKSVISNGVASEDETTLIRINECQVAAPQSTYVDSVQDVSHESSDDVHSLACPTATTVTDQDSSDRFRQCTASSLLFAHCPWNSESITANSVTQHTAFDTVEHVCMQVDKYPSQWGCSRASICHQSSLTADREHSFVLAGIVDKQLCEITGPLPYDKRGKEVRNSMTPMSVLKVLNEMGCPSAGACRIVDYTETSDCYVGTGNTSVSTPSEIDSDALGNGMTEFDSNSQTPSVLLHPNECSGRENIVNSIVTHSTPRKHSPSISLPEQLKLCFMNEFAESVHERMSSARQSAGFNTYLGRIHSSVGRMTEESGDKRQSVCSDASVRYCDFGIASPDHGPTMLSGFRPLQNQSLSRRSCGDFCLNRPIYSISLCPTQADFMFMRDFQNSQPDYFTCSRYMCSNSNSNQPPHLRWSSSAVTDSDESSRAESGLEGSSTLDSVVTLKMDPGNSTACSHSVAKVHSLEESPNLICILMNLKNSEAEPLKNEAFLVNHNTIEQRLRMSLRSGVGSAIRLSMMSNMISCAKNIAKLKRLRWFSLIGALGHENGSENRHLLEQQLDQLGSTVAADHIHESYVDGAAPQDSHNETMHSSLSIVTQAEANDTIIQATAFDSISSLCDSRCKPLHQGGHDYGAETDVSQWNTSGPHIDEGLVAKQTVKPHGTGETADKQPCYTDETSGAASSAPYHSGLISDSAPNAASVNATSIIDKLTDTQTAQHIESLDNDTEAMYSAEHNKKFKRNVKERTVSTHPINLLDDFTVGEACMKCDHANEGTKLSDARENAQCRHGAHIQDDSLSSDECLSSVVDMDVNAQSPQIENRGQQLKSNQISYQAQQGHSHPVTHNSRNQYIIDSERHRPIRVLEPTPPDSLNLSCGFLHVDQMPYFSVVPTDRHSVLSAQVDWEKGPTQEISGALMQSGMHYMRHRATLKSLSPPRSNEAPMDDRNLKADTSRTKTTANKCKNRAAITLPFASCEQGTQNFNVNRTQSRNQHATSSVGRVESTPTDDHEDKILPEQILDANVEWNKSVESDEFISRSPKNPKHNNGRLARPQVNSNGPPKRDKLGPLASKSLPAKYPPSPWSMPRGQQPAAPCSQTVSPKRSSVSLSAATQLPYSYNDAQTSETTEQSVNTGSIFNHPATPPRLPRRHWPSSRPQIPTKLGVKKQPPSSDASSYVGDSSHSVEHTEQHLQHVIQLFSGPINSLPLFAEPELLDMEATPIVTQVSQLSSFPAQTEQQRHDDVLLNEQPFSRLVPTKGTTGSRKQLTSTLQCPCPNNSDDTRCFATPYPNSQGNEIGCQVDDRHVGHYGTEWEANYRLSIVGKLPSHGSSQVQVNANVTLKKDGHSETGSAPSDTKPRIKSYLYLPHTEQENPGKLHDSLVTPEVRVITQFQPASISRTINDDSKVYHPASGEVPATNQVVYDPVKRENPKTEYFGMGCKQAAIGFVSNVPSRLTDVKPPTIFNSDNTCSPEAAWEAAANENEGGERMKITWSRPTLVYPAGMVRPAEELTLTTTYLTNILDTESTRRAGTIRKNPSFLQEKDEVDLMKKGHEKSNMFRGQVNSPDCKSGQFQFELKPQCWAEYLTKAPKDPQNITLGATFPVPVVSNELPMHGRSVKRKEVRVEKPLLTEVVEVTNTERLSVEHPIANPHGTGGLSSQRRIRNVPSDLSMDVLSHLIRSRSECLGGAPMPNGEDDKVAMGPLAVQTDGEVQPVGGLQLADRQLCETFQICHVQSRSITVSDNDDPSNQSLGSCAAAQSVMSVCTQHLNGGHQKTDNRAKNEDSLHALGNTKGDTNGSHIVNRMMASTSATQRRLYCPTAVSAEFEAPLSPVYTRDEKASQRSNKRVIHKINSNGGEVPNHAKKGRAAAGNHRFESSYTNLTTFRGKRVGLLRTASTPVGSTSDPNVIARRSLVNAEPVSMQLPSDSHACIKKAWCRFKALLQTPSGKRSLVHGTHNSSVTCNLKADSPMRGVKETSPDSVRASQIRGSRISALMMHRLYVCSRTSSLSLQVDTSSTASCVSNTTAPLYNSSSVSSSAECVSAETDFIDMFTNTVVCIPPSY